MARAKCPVCGTELNTSTAYKVEIVGPRTGKVTYKYYCSEEEWLSEQARKKKAKEDKDKAYYLICDIMGEKEIINTALWKEWVVWNKVADNEKIGKYLEENKSQLTSEISRLSSSEFAKIRYLSAIIKNGIKESEQRDEKKPVVIEAVNEQPAMYVNTKKINRRRGFAEEDD